MYDEWMENVPLDIDVREKYGNVNMSAIDKLVEKKLKEEKRKWI